MKKYHFDKKPTYVQRTRTVTIDKLHSFPAKNDPKDEEMELWGKPLDGLFPNYVVAYTYDRFIQDMLAQAQKGSGAVIVDLLEDTWGLRIIAAEEHREQVHRAV